jgi:hypothetical protein
MNIFEKLLAIQQELKAPKGQYNSFGKYNYRSCEDILEAVKPICAKYNTVLTVSDELVYMGDRYYIKATARLIDTEFPVGYDVSTQIPNVSKAVLEKHNSIENTAFAREEETKKGMDGSQITGTASSYARKYALNGLFCIDDTKDADTDEYKKQEQKAKEMGVKGIIELAELYANIKEGNADELLTYYMNKYKVAELADLTQAQANAIEKELTKLIRRVSNEGNK